MNNLKRWMWLIFRRRLFVCFILLVQIAVIIILPTSSIRTFKYVHTGLTGVSIIVCLYILNKKEKPAYKLTWIFLILLFPIFGGLIYIVIHSQTDSKKRIRLMNASDERAKAFYRLCGDRLPEIHAACPDHEKQARYLQERAGFPLFTHTQAAYFSSGEAFFARMFTELEKAEKYIFIEFFILSPGDILDRTIDILERKAASGVDVRLMYDDIGSIMTLPVDYKHRLEVKGIKCIVFNPFKPILSSQQNNRDHRKIVCIDGKTAFTGGVNLADEYVNVKTRFGHWKDAGVMLEGEGAWALTLIFLQMWNLFHAAQDNLELFFPWEFDECPTPSDGFVQPYADSPYDTENVGEHVYIQIINNAERYVYINTPYLVVDENLLSALCLAAKSGVDVRIITPHRWDKWFMAVVSRSYYSELISAGVRVYEYSDGFNHSKSFVSDDIVAAVGTTNLDFRSLYLHFECGVWMCRSSAVASVREDFLDTLPHCREITLPDCHRSAAQRVFQDLLRVFAPLM
ncbi:MAG: cardiolipin synthase [Treponema sp.]|jgi:cardiolipin synthase|nr:cardiolipin synthase [Treponema sp.]